MRGECYLKMSYASEALEDLKKSLDMEPNNKLYQSLLIDALFEDRKYEEAIRGKHGTRFPGIIFTDESDAM